MNCVKVSLTWNRSCLVEEQDPQVCLFGQVGEDMGKGEKLEENEEDEIAGDVPEEVSLDVVSIVAGLGYDRGLHQLSDQLLLQCIAITDIVHWPDTMHYALSAIKSPFLSPPL